MRASKAGGSWLELAAWTREEPERMLMYEEMRAGDLSL
jgi:hypothetical protein